MSAAEKSGKSAKRFESRPVNATRRWCRSESLLFRQMTLKVAPVVKNAQNVDDLLAFATAIDEEVPGISHNSKSSSRSAPAETQVIGTDAFLKLALVLRTWAIHISCDVAKGLDQKILITQGGIPPEFRVTPHQNLS